MVREQEIDLSITHFNAKGWGRGSHGPSLVEVIGAVPGDSLKVKLWKKKRGKWRADLLQILEPSSDRVPVRCAHAPQCGGCVWQQMDYGAQLREKQRWLEGVFAPVFDSVSPILPCLNPWAYRNKMEFSFSQTKAGERFLGLVLAGTRGHVFNLSECHLVSPWFSQVVGGVRKWWEGTDLSAYRMNDTGSLRTLTVREGLRTGHKLAMLTVSGNPLFALNQTHLKGFVEAVRATVPEQDWPTLSLFLRIQQLQKGSPTQFFEMHLSGPDHLKETLRLPLNSKCDSEVELHFKVSPTSFFQPNTFQAERLYAEALKCIDTEKNHVLDLYAGTATLGMAIASRARRVTAIELNPYACFDAQVNRELNGIDHLEVICGDVGDELQKLKESPDLIIVDPPRTGLDAKALSHLTQLQSPEILYISCNPLTQVENLKELLAHGYSVVKIQPVDQFPHTMHVETVAFLRKS